MNRHCVWGHNIDRVCLGLVMNYTNRLARLILRILTSNSYTFTFNVKVHFSRSGFQPPSLRKTAQIIKQWFPILYQQHLKNTHVWFGTQFKNAQSHLQVLWKMVTDTLVVTAFDDLRSFCLLVHQCRVTHPLLTITHIHQKGRKKIIKPPPTQNHLQKNRKKHKHTHRKQANTYGKHTQGFKHFCEITHEACEVEYIIITVYSVLGWNV